MVPKIAITAFQKLASEFPCIIPDDTVLSSFSGFILVNGREFAVRISTDCSRFDADDNVTDVLGSTTVLKERLGSSSNAYEFLIELRDLLERAMAKEKQTVKRADGSLPPAKYYERVLSEISMIGWDNVVSMDQRMRSLDVEVCDKGKRKHVIGMMLPADYPTNGPRCVASLPLPFETVWQKEMSLESIVKQFGREVDKFENFFTVTDDFDEHCWVLEPEHPTRRDAYRRLSLGKQCSMRVEIDARAPIKGFPECRFLGAESAIAPFRQRLNENIHQWDMSGKVLPRGNLERILQMQFPSRREDEGGVEEDMALECGICYTYRIEDRVPDVACDLEKCAKAYHKECLIEWFRALPDTRESFGTITGNCVYCEQPISVSDK